MKKSEGEVEILVAEDSPTQSAKLVHLLEQQGYTVTAARNGIEALALLERLTPALVITDVMMPELDGYGLCKAIKSDERWKHIPVVLVTTLVDAHDVIRGLECGADNFIRKPYEEKYLLSRIHYLLMNISMRKNQRMQMGVEISLAGQKHFISADRQQILDLLISTYEQAVLINNDLKLRERELGEANQVLTAMYRIAAGLNRADTEREVADLALDRALELPGIEAGWILLREDESRFRVAAARNVPPALPVSGALEADCACLRRCVDGAADTAVNIPDCERFQKTAGDRRDLRHHASVLLRVGGRSVGVMNLMGGEQGLFSEEELRILENVGNQVAVAFDRTLLRGHLEKLVEERTANLEAEITERMRIEEELRRQARREAAVAELGRIAMTSTTLNPLFDEACRVVARTIDVDAVTVVEAPPGGGVAVVCAAIGWPGGTGGRALPAEDASQTHYMLSSGSPVVVSDYRSEIRFRPPRAMIEQQMAASVGAVIPGEGRPFGTLTAFTRNAGVLSEGDALFMRAVANLLAATIARKATEESLHRSQALFQIASRVGRVGAWAVDLPQRALTWSDEVRAIHEVGPEYVPVVEEAIDFYAPEFRDTIAGAVESCLRDGTPFDLELQIITARGRRVWVRNIGEAQRDADGVIRRIHGAFQDISGRKEAAEETRRLAERLTETLESITDAFMTIDRNGRFSYLNAQGERLLQRSRADLLGKVIWDELPEVQGTAFEREYLRGMTEGVPVSFEHYYAPLSSWMEVRAYPSPQGLTIYARDVTEQRQSREAIREQAALIDQAHDAIIVRDLEHRIAFWSKGAERLYGWAAADAIGSRIDELLQVPQSAFVPAVQAVIENGEWTGQIEKTTRSGTAVVVDARWTLLRDGEGAPRSILTLDSDITERKRAEIQLYESEERYRLLFDRNPHPTWVYDVETLRFLAVNDAATRHYGYSKEEFLAMTLRDIRPPDDVPELQGALAKRPETPEPRVFGVFRHRKKDGTVIEVEIASSEIIFSGRRAGLVLAVDVTEKHRLEQQLFRIQRMESIGTLAGGIAHDLNNLLMPVMMGVALLKREHPSERSLRALQNMERSAARGKELVQQVLSFARGVEGSRVPVHLGDVIREIESIMENTFPKNIALHTDVADDLRWIDGDPTQLNQVLLNLTVNARDAMPAGGRITVSAKNEVIDEHYASMHRDVAAGEYVTVTVADEGVGMAQSVIDRIFEPFFTTKDLGRGTGLGLSTVAAIVRGHGGSVRVYSEPGQGSVFTIHLPARRAGDKGEAAKEPRSIEELRGNGELIMIVDDEASVLAVTQQTLEAFGYRVITATDGAQAIGLYAMHRSDVALVITDMMMPVMDGVALIAAIRRIDSSVPIVASSGLRDDGRVAKAAQADVRHFLQKPYSANALLSTLHRVLGSSREAPHE